MVICISKARFSSNIHQIKILSLTIFMYLFSPLIFLSILLLHLVRSCVSICAKLSNQDLDKLISPSSAILASDDLYGIPSNNIVVWFVLKGRVSIDTLQSVINEKVINKQSLSGQSVYSQLKQFPTRFYKFLFWRWEEEFRIESHVYVHEKAKDDNKFWNESEVLEIQGNLLRKQWTRHRSPWEIFLVPNYKPVNSTYREPKTVMFLRFHECLGDSFSWFQLFITNLCDCDNAGGHHFPKFRENVSTILPLSNGEGNKGYVTNMSTMYRSIVSPFKIPFDLAQQLLEPRDANEWNVIESKLIKRDHLKIIDKFSIQHIKDIRCMLGVSFTSVLLAAATAAIRTTFINTGLKIPRNMKVAFPILEGVQSEDKLGNGLSPCYVKLPTGIASARERLRICEEFYNKMRKSTIPTSNLCIRDIVGLLPFKCFKTFTKNRPWTGSILNLPCSFEYTSIAEHTVEDFVVASAKDTGFAMTFLSYADYIRMSLVVDHRLIPVEQHDIAKDLLKNMYAELVLLGIEAVV